MAGRATGERIEPRRTAKVITGVANGMSVNKVAKFANVDRATATAIVERNSATIQQRKERLTDVYAEIAQRGAERLLNGIDTAPYGSLTVITGMSTDKLIALTTDPQSQFNSHIHVHLQKVDLIGSFNDAIHKLQNHNGVASTEPKQISAKEIEDKQNG